MIWIPETPTQPGWYWLQVDKREPFVVRVVVEPIGAARQIYIRSVGAYDHYTLRENQSLPGAQWFGPLPVPGEFGMVHI